MSDPFVHLHVASGYSLRYGAAHPPALVARAAEYGMDTIALTDRDGLSGAVRLVRAAAAAGIRPVLGVDLTVAPELPSAPPPHRRTPARGGPPVEDPTLPRVTVLAAGGRGYAALCRLVSAAHGQLPGAADGRVLPGGRGRPLATLALIAEYAALAATPDGRGATGALLVLLGPGSEPVRALVARRPGLARAELHRWRSALPAGCLLAEVVHHRGRGDAARAGQLAAFAAAEHLPAVLTNAVRYLEPGDAPVADVLDAARRLVPLDARHLERRTAEAYLKAGKEMADLAEEVVRHAGEVGHRAAADLLARTRAVADRCALDPAADLGMGTAHLPELEVLTGQRPVARSGRAETAQEAARRADGVLRQRCEAGFGRRGSVVDAAARRRLDDELAMIAGLGYASYFLTVADVTDLIRSMGVRCAARGSGAGSLVTFLTGVSDVDPIRYGLLVERFLSPLRHELPDVDIDVESARRTEVYQRIFERYGSERVACVAMMDTYRARHAIRDVGAALGLPPGEIDTIAKAFPHIRAGQLRAALRDLPELRASGLGEARLDLLFRLAERLDGLPRHIALHPCGVLLSDRTLLDRTPVEQSLLGFPMSQFDKDDVEALGLLKLDVLGIRMQSAIAHALAEVERVDGQRPDIDEVPRDDPETFRLIRSTRTLGCFQIESPGQRELVGKFGPETFDDLIVDISLFRPGPVKSDMVRPFLAARQGWDVAHYPHPDLEPALAETHGVVVFHEQVLQILAVTTGISLAEADETRRALGDPALQQEVRAWFLPAALHRGYDVATAEVVWEILKAFGSFGFCKAHAAAFAVPTYHSAWLKAHHPAAFLAGVLTHDPGMYPKRLILDDARQFGIAILGLDVNVSDDTYRLERLGPLDEPPPTILDQVDDPTRGPRDGPWSERPDPAGHPGLPAPRSRAILASERAWPDPGGPEGDSPDGGGPVDARGYGIRLSLADVRGISTDEIARLVAGRPFASLSDCWYRAAPSRPVAERLVLAGGFDSIYGLGSPAPVRRRGQVTRRDLLLQVGELDHAARTAVRTAARGRRAPSATPVSGPPSAGAVRPPPTSGGGRPEGGAAVFRDSRPGRPVQPPRTAAPPPAVQLTLEFGDDLLGHAPSGLPEMTPVERVRAELDVLGLDASSHVLTGYAPFLTELGVTRSRDLLSCRSEAELLVAGVKVATQTPPIRSGRRVVFLTLDDATGPIDATLFEEAQRGYAATVFHSWLLVVRGRLRRTGPRGVSLLALACWELPVLHAAWGVGGLAAVEAAMAGAPGWESEAARHGAADSRSSRPVTARPPGPVIEHATGFLQSSYADIKPSGEDAKSAVRKLWHASPGSSGR